jgi:hypothetical protein
VTSAIQIIATAVALAAPAVHVEAPDSVMDKETRLPVRSLVADALEEAGCAIAPEKGQAEAAIYLDAAYPESMECTVATRASYEGRALEVANKPVVPPEIAFCTHQDFQASIRAHAVRACVEIQRAEAAAMAAIAASREVRAEAVVEEPTMVQPIDPASEAKGWNGWQWAAATAAVGAVAMATVAVIEGSKDGEARDAERPQTYDAKPLGPAIGAGVLGVAAGVLFMVGGTF